MSISYQSLLGLSDLQTDSISVQTLNAGTVNIDEDANITGNLNVDGTSNLTTVDINGPLAIYTGATLDYILTSDAIGNATWQAPAVATLAGDITGPSNANIQSRKYIGPWDTLTTYEINNQVSQSDSLFRAITVNTNNDPLTSPTDWELVLRGISLTNTNLLNNATNLNTANTLVKRDGSGNFSANIITSNLIGNSSTSTLATNVITNANLTGMVTSIGNSTTVVTNANLTGMVTSSGNSTTVVTNANLTNEATSIGNSVTLLNSAVIGKVLTGYVSGAGTVVATDNILQAVQKLNGNIVANTGVSTATPNTLALRDSNADCSFASITMTTLKLGTDVVFNTTTNKIVVGINSGGSANLVGTTVVGHGSANLIAGIGAYNTIIGSQASQYLTTGTGNTTVGFQSLFTSTTGNYNSALGTYAGLGSIGTNNTGSNCTFLGYQSNYSPASSSFTNSTALGSNSTITASNMIQLGDTNVTLVKTSGSINSGGITSSGTIACVNLFATGAIFSSNNISGSGFYTPPFQQGNYLSWNKSGSGEATFICQQGGGSGGWQWCNFNLSNVMSPSTPSMTLTSSGNLTTLGDITSSNNIFASGSIGAGLTTTPTVRGGYIGWNRPGSFSAGSMCFSTNFGSGSGGFEFMNYNLSGVATPSTSLLNIAPTGIIYPLAGISLPSSGGTPSLLNYYEEYTHATQWVGQGTTLPSSNIFITRIGRIVTAMVTQQFNQPTSSASTNYTMNNTLPNRFRPSITQWHNIAGIVNGVDSILCVGAGSTMSIYVGPYQNGPQWPATSAVNGWVAFTMSWSA